MSGQATINLVDDEEMSLQGSINVPIATPRVGSPSQVSTTQLQEIPSRLPRWSVMPGAMPVQIPTPTMQSNMYARLSGMAVTVPMMGGRAETSTIALTVPIDAPSQQETKEAFAEVSSTF